MRLLASPTSPYTRKARVLALELGLELDIAWVDPLADPPELLSLSPLGKVPVLETADGALYDSRVIADALCTFVGAELPTPVERRDEALGDGIMDEALVMRLARVRGIGELDWVGRSWEKIGRVIDHLEANVPEGFDRPAIAVACALLYLDFRLGDLDWRSTHPKLVAWLDEAQKRPSMVATEYGKK